MIRKSLLIVYTLFLFLITSSAMASSGWMFFYEDAFKGKVIDSETLGPIEGAVVAAIYSVAVPLPAGPVRDIEDVQETLTDSNGEFHIPGNFFFNLWPFSSGQRTEFTIYKPGYGVYPGNYSFLIYPVKEASRIPGTKTTKKNVRTEEITIPKKNMTTRDDNKLNKKHSTSRLRKGSMAKEESREGIVFEKIMTDLEEWKLYREKFDGYSPYIPLKNAFEKVRNLDLPFDADVMNAEGLWTAYSEPFKSYVLIGLPKARTLEERKDSHSDALRIPPEFKSKVPIWKGMLDDERNFIFKRRR